jgi:hypothetical protein
MEEGCDRTSIQVKLNRKIRELKEEVQEVDSLKNVAESILRGQTEYYKRKLQEKDALREQVEDALYETSKELEERVRGSRVFEKVFRRMCEGYEKRIIEANLENNIAISRMERLEIEIRRKDRDKETVEANLRCEINELSEKLRTSDMHYKEVEAALHDQIDKLNKHLKTKKQGKEEVVCALRGEINKLVRIICKTKT